MASPAFAFYLTCLFLGKMVPTTALEFSSSAHQDGSFISSDVGEEVTLRCSYEGSVSPQLYWVKQTLGQKPRRISSFHHTEKRVTFHNEFKNNSRFTVDNKNNKNHLEIKDLHISDSATYYCISVYIYSFDFLESITLNVKGSGVNVPVSVHQSTSESMEPGGSETLNCTVHTGTCGDGEHSVYWFKDSGEPHPGIIYTHGGRNDQCVRNRDTQTHTCVYNLPMKSVDVSHAGTYYCAVASCGRILFGNGTKLEDEVDSLVLVYFFSAAFFSTVILSVFLAFLLYKMNKSFKSTEHAATFSAPGGEVHHDADNLHYAALNVNQPNRSRRTRNNTTDECVYSGVKQHNYRRDIYTS